MQRTRGEGRRGVGERRGGGDEEMRRGVRIWKVSKPPSRLEFTASQDVLSLHYSISLHFNVFSLYSLPLSLNHVCFAKAYKNNNNTIYNSTL